MKKIALSILTLFHLLYAFSQEVKEKLPQYTRNDILIDNETIKEFKIKSTDQFNDRIIYLDRADLFSIKQVKNMESKTTGSWRLDPKGDKKYYVLRLSVMRYDYLDEQEITIQTYKYYIDIRKFYVNKVKHKFNTVIKKSNTIETIELIPIKQ
jgi:hypothetical protein